LFCKYCGLIWRNLHFPVPVGYRNSIASKIDATHVIKAHPIIQFVVPRNAGKMNQRVSRFSNFLGRPSDFPPARPFLMNWTPALAKSYRSATAIVLSSFGPGFGLHILVLFTSLFAV